MRYLDPVALARLRNMRFDLRRHLAEGHLSGRHRSVLRGFSQEFAQHRSYSPGDELKHLDWKVYARKDRFFIKEFQEEKSLTTYVLADASGSMGYRGRGETDKWERGCRLAMSLSYLVLSQGDAAGLVTFDSNVREFVAPRRNLAHLDVLDSTFARTRPGGETDLGRSLMKALERVPRRSLVVLVSDLLGDAESILRCLRAFGARKHRILVLQVLDPRERDLDVEGPVVFESMEGEESLRCEAALLREEYRSAFDARQRLYRATFDGIGVFFDTFYTDEAWDAGLTRFLAVQNAIG